MNWVACRLHLELLIYPRLQSTCTTVHVRLADPGAMMQGRPQISDLVAQAAVQLGGIVRLLFFVCHLCVQ